MTSSVNALLGYIGDQMSAGEFGREPVRTHTRESIDSLPSNDFPVDSLEDLPSLEPLYSLGDIRAYPLSTSEALNRAQRARQISALDLCQRGKSILSQELARCEDTLAWDTGKSRLPTYTASDGKEYTNYMSYITPGEYVLRKDYDNVEEYKRHHAIAVRRDIAKYYRFSPAMMRHKNSIIICIQKAARKLCSILASYPPGARFRLEIEGDRVVMIGQLDLDRLNWAFERLVREQEYALRARSMRNPFAPQEPLNYLGKHQRVVFNSTLCRWIKREEELEAFRTYIAGEDFGVSYTALGMSTMYSMCLIFRSFLCRHVSPYKIDDHTRYRYETTEKMRAILNSPEYIDVLRLTGYVRGMISPAATDDQEDFLAHDDPDEGEEFAETIAYIQEYSDYVMSERRARKKVTLPH